jgi:hypothetical protein
LIKDAKVRKFQLLSRRLIAGKYKILVNVKVIKVETSDNEKWTIFAMKH